MFVLSGFDVEACATLFPGSIKRVFFTVNHSSVAYSVSNCSQFCAEFTSDWLSITLIRRIYQASFHFDFFFFFVSVLCSLFYITAELL